MENGSKRKDKKPQGPAASYNQRNLDELLKLCQGVQSVYNDIRQNVSRDVLSRLKFEHEQRVSGASPDKEVVRTLIKVGGQPRFVICTQIKGGRQTAYAKFFPDQPIDSTVSI